MFLTIIGAASLAVWLYLLSARGGFWRMRPDFAPDVRHAALRALAPSVTAVVPARNEAAVVRRSVGSLAAQEYTGEFHMILVDDASHDGTASLALEAAPQLRVVTACPLPPGWTGKVWAVAEGVRAADSEYLLLTDADIVHPPKHLAELVARAHEGGYDLVSYMVRLHCRSLAEQALIPAFVFFFFLLYPPAWIRVFLGVQVLTTGGVSPGCSCCQSFPRGGQHGSIRCVRCAGSRLSRCPRGMANHASARITQPR